MKTDTLVIYCFMYYPHLLILKAHFEDNQFEQDRQDGRKLLKWNAVPIQFDEE